MPDPMDPPLKTWFRWLDATHNKMPDLNTQTSADPVTFANKQSPKDLLTNDSQRGELSRALSAIFGVAPPDEAFVTTSFRNFVDVTVPDRDSDVRNAAYLSAIRNDPSVGNLTQRQFGKKKPSAMFPTPASINDLFNTLDSLAPDEFFPSTVANRARLNDLIANSASMDSVCRTVLA